MWHYSYALNISVLNHSLKKIVFQKAIYCQYKSYEIEAIGVIKKQLRYQRAQKRPTRELE